MLVHDRRSRPELPPKCSGRNHLTAAVVELTEVMLVDVTVDLYPLGVWGRQGLVAPGARDSTRT